MNLKELQENWDQFGKLDPLTAIFKPKTQGKKWNLEEFFQLGSQEINSLMKELDSIPWSQRRGRALDFGCGIGRLTQALAPYFNEVLGIDIAPSMIQQAREYNRYAEKCAYFLNESDDLKLFPNNYFDFIYSNITLQHIEPRYSLNYLREFFRILVPSGLLVFQLPSERKRSSENQNWMRKVKRFLRPAVPKLVLNTYYRMKGIEPEEAVPEDHPQMEMYAIPHEKVVHELEEAGGKVLRVHQNENSGPHWVSLKYFAIKQ